MKTHALKIFLLFISCTLLLFSSLTLASPHITAGNATLTTNATITTSAKTIAQNATIFVSPTQNSTAPDSTAPIIPSQNSTAPSTTTSAPFTQNATAQNGVALTLPIHDAATPTSIAPMTWHTLSHNLQVGVASASANQSLRQPSFVLMVIPATGYRFALHMASQEGATYNLIQWAQQYQLTAAINASMYLPDNRTSIGYMRNTNHINNPTIKKKLGAFFVASPIKKGLPQANILTSDMPDVQAQIKNYQIVVQNFRFTNEQSDLLWTKKERHSIAIIGKTTSNEIFFAFCEHPLSPKEFHSLLIHYLPTLSVSMYVEGGTHAQLLVTGKQIFPTPQNTKTQSEIDIPYTLFSGQHSLLSNQHNSPIPLPNILSIQPESE